MGCTNSGSSCATLAIQHFYQWISIPLRLSSVRVHFFRYRPFLGIGVQIIISNFCYYDTTSGK
jgi:hypothetical protein